jgi:hypothetical protein
MHEVEQQSEPFVHQDRIPFGTQQRPARQTYASQQAAPPSAPHVSPAPRQMGGPSVPLASLEASAAESASPPSLGTALPAEPPASSKGSPALPPDDVPAAPVPAVAEPAVPPAIVPPVPAAPPLVEPALAAALGDPSSLPQAAPRTARTHIQRVGFDFMLNL